MDKSPEPEIEEEDEAVELGALRTMIDFGSFGDSVGFQPDIAASGSERDRSDKHNVMLEVLGGAALAYGQDVLMYSAGTVVFVLFPPAYFAWQGYNFWSSVASGGIEGYRQDGVFGAVAGAINAVNPFAHVGISLAKTIDAAERGDYAGAGENGYRTAVGIAGIAAAAIGGGIGSGGGRGGSGPWAPNGVRQGGAVARTAPGSCGSACAEMLSGGARAQGQVLAEIGEWASAGDVAGALGPGWRAGYFGSGADALTVANRGSMGGVLWEPGARAGHMVVIEPRPGGFLIRDPLPGVNYTVGASWIEQWVAGGVWR